MFAKDIMTLNVITVGPDTPINEIAKLLIERRISAAPVVDEGNILIGIVSEGDLVHRIRGDHELPRSWWLSLIGDPNDEPQEYIRSHGKTAKDVMTKDVETISEFTSISEIAETLEAKKIKRVPVVDDGKLVGIVSRANLIQALVAHKETGLPKTSTSDQEIRETLMTEFNNHAWATNATLNVVVNDGVVRYWGFVESEVAKEALQLAAENVPGVVSVESNLGISAAPTDYI
ncbi:MAG: CBS domain-containing protein [Rhodospirillaceae bacterium]|jgi:CBS-domain-containing membrane protein|nr:CBS domain-containing protein [Rhodospirillaceae bacterium]MBT4589539.1 CBS domain-containing protein [Rhodospirillaceae bacterium]MBT4939855.1 CBS domain-containing protein [Rhodospirillaceae bacterium]MBT5938439.1 CBS domain-containing protein [Rhodospirillaceae bacterium]MBT7268459.1 CBS domain-containing protein [Rhodospirillaceae bacterium]